MDGSSMPQDDRLIPDADDPLLPSDAPRQSASRLVPARRTQPKRRYRVGPGRVLSSDP